MNWSRFSSRSRQPLPAPRAYRREQWSGTLEGAEPGIEWRAEWTVVWWVEGSPDAHPAPASIAAVAIRDRALPLVRAEGANGDMVQHVLAAELGHPRPVAAGSRMWAGTEDVRVALTEHSAALIRRKRDRAAELAEIAHLRENVLSDLPHAVLWWLQRNEYRVGDAVREVENLRKLIHVVRGEQVAKPWTERLSSALDEAMPGLEVQNRWDVFDQVQRLMKGYGHGDAADELARHLG